MTDETLEQFKERIKKEYGPRYFDRQGKPMELMDLARKCEDNEYRIVKQEKLDRWFISTVWMGLNMQMFKENPIHIFETMIFLENEDRKCDDRLNFYQERYSTETEALHGHELALELCRAQSLKEKSNQGE